MRRRDFLSVAASAAAFPRLALAQQPSAVAGSSEILSLIASSPFVSALPPEAAWSADSTQIVLTAAEPLSRESELILFSVSDAGFVRRAAIGGLDEVLALAWRPDGGAVAFQERDRGTGLIRLRVLSIPDLKPVAVRELDRNGGRIDGHLLMHAPRSMAFSDDGSMLWVGTSSIPGPIAMDRLPVALALDAYSLKRVDTLELTSPVPGAMSDFGGPSLKVAGGDTVLERTDQGLRATVLVMWRETPSAPGARPADVSRWTVYSVNLKTKEDIFPPLELPRDNAALTNRTPDSVQLSADSQILIARMGGPDQRALGGPTPASRLQMDRDADVFDLSTRARVAVLGGVGSPYRAFFEPGGGASITPHGRFYLLSARTEVRPSATTGRLVAFDPYTGAIAQAVEIPSSQWPLGWAASSSETWLAVPVGKFPPWRTTALLLYRIRDQ